MIVPNATWTSVAKSATDRGSDTSPTTAASARASIARRCVAWITTVHPGEGKRVLGFVSYAFLLLVCYYLLKTIREPLLLDRGSAELKSYAYAAIACVLLVVVPLYGALFRRSDTRQLTQRITVFCVAALALFYLLGTANVDIGFAYYVFVGVFSVTIIAQFWAHAAHSYDVESGQRLFPLIMAGAALGALAGPWLSGALFPLLGPWNLMLLAIAALVATLPVLGATCRRTPERSHAPPVARTPRGHALGGFALVLRDHHLLLLAALAVLLNCVNTTGEYILTQLVLDDASRQIAADPALEKGNLIAAFYGNYYFAVNALSLACQVLVVSRIFRRFGAANAILVLPMIALIGYGLVVFVPVFSIIRAVKIIENSVDYSIMNTARHALYLPLPTTHQYEGKTTIDTFFWRFGDVVQAGLIYAGLNWLGFDIAHFAVVNMLLTGIWLAVAVRIGKRYEGTFPRIRINWRATAVAAGSAAFAVIAFAVPKDAGAGAAAAAQVPELFDTEEPLAMELRMNVRDLCRGAKQDGECAAGAPATLSYVDSDGAEQRLDVRLRPRGKWRAESGHCAIPPLFVSFDANTALGTIFEGQTMLPLTTHCRETSSYEQYVLKEYLAYRIYNTLTDKSLRVRLARIAYRDAGRRDRVVERYAFFTEHFDSLAARQQAEVYEPENFDRLAADPLELGTLDLFQYLIGNTDWSDLKGHNVVHIRAQDGRVTAVPYDFDFSGLVDADYAGPPPSLPIKTVTQRLFRGFCRPEFDWRAVFATFQTQHRAITNLVEQTPMLAADQRRKANAYLETFFAVLDSPKRDDIVKSCYTAAGR